jgi:hypothetical protein
MLQSGFIKQNIRIMRCYRELGRTVFNYIMSLKDDD